MPNHVLSALRSLVFAFLAGACAAGAVLPAARPPASVPYPRASAALSAGLAAADDAHRAAELHGGA